MAGRTRTEGGSGQVPETRLLCNPCLAGIFLNGTSAEPSSHCNRRHARVILFQRDPGLADDAAPALLFGAEISVERFGRESNGHEPLIDAQPLEGLGLDRRGRRSIKPIDHLSRYSS